jgi:hypothetical protein
LKIGTDRPGGKLRCPSCNTPFVLGSRVGAASGGTAEFQAFELFEENVILDAFTIEEETASSPPPPPKPVLKPSFNKPKPPPAPTPSPPPAPAPTLRVHQPAAAEDDLDLLHEGPSLPKAPPLPSSPPPAPRVDEPILPESVEMIEDGPHLRRAPASRPKQSAPAPKAVPPAFSERLSPSSHAQRGKPERESSAAPAAPSGDEFFLPADFDPFAPPPPKPNLPDLSLDEPASGIIPESDPQRVAADFEIIEEPARAAHDGIVVVGGAGDTEAIASRPNPPAEVDFDIADRRPRREQRRGRREERRANARRAMIHEEKRGRRRRGARRAGWRLVDDHRHVR